MRIWRRTVIYALLVLIAATTVVPVVWMVFTSLHHKEAETPTMRSLFVPATWRFVAWTGDAQGSAPRISVVMDRDREIRAVFEKAKRDQPPTTLPAQPPEEPPAAGPRRDRCQLTVRTRGSGEVKVTPESADGTYPFGTRVQLEAVPTSGWHFDNYRYVLTFGELPVWRFAVNSFVVTTGVVLLQLTLCALAAFGFSRLQFRGRDTLFFVFLLTMMIPAQVLVVPLFMFVQKLGWLDTYLGLIVPYAYLSTAFGTFLLRQFFITLPQSLDDAARLDGCGELRLLWHVILPSAKPALATLAAFGFIWTWTDFYWPLLATSSTEMRTLEVGLSVFKDAYGTMRWPLQMTAAVIVLTPVLIVFLAMQRFFVRGVVLTGLKE